MEHTSLIGGRYVLGELLGCGGMGRVYRARDEVLGREVALKVLHEQHAESEEFVERFQREARRAAALNHPNVVSVYDAGAAAYGEGTPYMAMEYVGGGTLKERILERGGLPARTAAEVALQIAEALCAAHARGLVHRDIKPQNVLVTENGDVKVADFGIAQAASETAMTQSSLILGTARYVSPEQARGEAVGPASDLYSLGITLYEMLTGRVPFEAESPLAIAMKQLTEAPAPLRALDASVPEGLEAITLKLLSKDPAERYESASTLADDLERFLAGEAVAAQKEDVARIAETTKIAAQEEARHTGRRRRRRPLAGFILVALLVPIAAVAGLSESLAQAPLIGGLFSPEDSQQPLRRALGPSMPAGEEKLKAPEEAAAKEEAPEKREAAAPEEDAQLTPGNPGQATLQFQQQPAPTPKPAPRPEPQPQQHSHRAPQTVVVEASSGPPPAPEEPVVEASSGPPPAPEEPVVVAESEEIEAVEPPDVKPPDVEPPEVELPEVEPPKIEPPDVKP